MTTVWGIHNDKIPASTLVDQGFVSIGWNEIGDLHRAGNDQSTIKAMVAETYPDAKPGAIPAWAGTLRRFAFELAIGDLVVAPSKQRSVYNIGRVTGPYQFVAEAAIHRHRRPVEWLRVDAPKDAFSQRARREVGSATTFFRVDDHAEEFEQAATPDWPTPKPPGPKEVRHGVLQRTVLEILRTSGPVPRSTIIGELADRIELTEFELATTSLRFPRYETAVNSSSVDMRAAGWMEKSGEEWDITEAGRQTLESAPANTDLSQISGAAFREVQEAKRKAAERFKSDRYPLIDAAVKLIGHGQWITYTDIASAVGSNAPSVAEYVHRMELEGNHRVVPVGQPPTGPGQRDALQAEGVEFDSRGLPESRHQLTAADLREEMELLGLLPRIAKRAWLIRGSRVNGKDLVPMWRAQGWVSLAAANLRPVEPGLNRDELKPIVDDDYSHASYAVKGEKLDEFHAFLTRMQDGHVVVTVDQGRLYIGTLTGVASHRASSEGDSNLVRDVEWVEGDGVDCNDLPGELAARLTGQRDVLDLTQQLGTIESLLKSEDDKLPPPPVEPVVLPAATSELAQSLHVSQAWLQECIDLLNDRPQLVFYGPPGTGKTFIAQALAKHVAGEHVRLVQFHPSYAYEDFFEGYRPTSGAGFELKPGPMRKIVDQAVENPRDAFVLIIDEINRGNLAKVFGELYFLLEYRDQNVELLYADEDFSLPKNVFIIGTMNTADRSIALVDAAMRRRFAFLPLHPTEAPTRDVLRSWLAHEGHPERVADLLDELNRRIEDPDFKIGPSYFMRSAVHAEGGLERTWRTSILPLLEEHHFGEMDAKRVAACYGLAEVARAVDMAEEEIGASPDPD